MSKPDKATTEKFTKTLRELVKKPDNKVCADCKRNDPRWASWNLGVFLCIRCSGIHRGMGTHISKVKSVDLDVWTPEQMESIQKWGNYLANLYWEAHLKPGHIPPEHKMESFIRSKYESRRWALDGPPPADPSVLDNGSSPPVPVVPQQQQQRSSPSANTSGPTHTPSDSVSSRVSVTTRQPQAHQLLSANYATNANRKTTAPSAIDHPSIVQSPTPPLQELKAPENDIFSLDFHAPPAINGSVSQQAPKKDVKQDILSLYSSQTQPAPLPFGQSGGVQASHWGNGQAPAQQPVQMQAQTQHPTSMLGSSGTGVWGVSSGWNGSLAPSTQGNIWGGAGTTTPAALPISGYQQQTNLFDNSVWGGSTSISQPSQDPFGASLSGVASSHKKDDVFGDLWGSFK